jgi:hypothetical protein
MSSTFGGSRKKYSNNTQSIIRNKEGLFSKNLKGKSTSSAPVALKLPVLSEKRRYTHGISYSSVNNKPLKLKITFIKLEYLANIKIISFMIGIFMFFLLKPFVINKKVMKLNLFIILLLSVIFKISHFYEFDFVYNAFGGLIITIVFQIFKLVLFPEEDGGEESVEC